MTSRSNAAAATAREETGRSLNDIATDILLAWGARTPRVVRGMVETMAALRGVEDEHSRRIVAAVRSAMHPLRSPTTSRIKRELETLLCRYRAERS